MRAHERVNRILISALKEPELVVLEHSVALREKTPRIPRRRRQQRRPCSRPSRARENFRVARRILGFPLAAAPLALENPRRPFGEATRSTTVTMSIHIAVTLLHRAFYLLSLSFFLIFSQSTRRRYIILFPRPPWAFSPIVLLSVRVSNNAWATLAPFFRRTPSHTHAGRKHLLHYVTPLAGPLASPAHSLAASIYLLVSGNRRPSRRFSLPSSTPTPVVTRDRLAGLTRREVRFFLNVRTGTRSITNGVFPVGTRRHGLCC